MYQLILLFCVIIPQNMWNQNNEAVTSELLSPNTRRVKIHSYFVSEFPTSRQVGIGKENEPVEYVIITTDVLKTAWEPLQDWKKEKGLNCVIKTIEWIDENYGGGDTPERIRNFLKDAYNNWGTRYVLLGGDVDKVPTRQVRSDNMYSPYYLIACDYYYSCLKGSWNGNQNGMWGEVSIDSCDFTPLVSVGRLFASNAEEVKVNINKIIKYEKEPDTAGIEKVLFISDEAHQAQCEQVAEYFPGNFVKDFLSTPNFVHDSVMAYLNKGYGNVYVTLHGATPQAWALDEGGFSREDVDAVKSSYFFMVCVSCYVNWIEIDCLSRHFMLNPEGGSFAYLGSSRVGWFTEELQYNKYLYEGIFDSLYTIGEAVCYAKRKIEPYFKSGGGEVSNNYRDVEMSYVFEGDPAIKIWRHIPESLRVSYPLNVGSGEQEFKVTIKDINSVPVENALVCVSRNNEVYAKGETNTNGEIIFEVCPESQGTMKVMAVKDGFLPYEGQVSVEPGLSYVRYKGCFIDGNGLAESGKESMLSVVLENTGALNADGVQCKISASSPYVTFKDSIIDYGDIPAGWDRTQDYQLQINKNCEDGEVPFTTFSYCMGDTIQDTFSLWVHAPKLSHFSHTYVSLAGDTAGIYIKIKNESSTKAIKARARLKSCIPEITVIDSIYDIGSILPNKVQKIPQVFRFVGDTIPEFMLELSDSFSHIWLDTFEVVSIRPPIELSTISGEYKITVQWGPDSLIKPMGYNIYRAPDSILLSSTLIKENPIWDDTRLDPYRAYFYWVTAVDSFLNESNFSEMVEGKANPSLKNGWPQKGGTEFLGSPVCGELDPSYHGFEIVVNGGGNDSIYAWHSDGTGYFSGNPIFSDSFGDDWSAPAIGDIDGDSLLEVVSVEFWTGNRICAFKPNGSIVPGWPRELIEDYGATSYPVLQDLDGDGKLEVIVVGYTDYPKNWLFVWRADGTGFSQTNGRFASLYRGHFKMSSPAVADINGDGFLDIVVGCRDSLYAFNLDTSRIVGWPVSIGKDAATSFPAIGDVDTSYPGLEIAIHTDVGWVYLFHSDGSLASGWPKPCLTGFWCQMSAPILGDMNADGNLEVLCAGNDCFYVWEKGGQNIPGWPVRLPTMNTVSNATPLIGDVDGDGKQEVIGITHMGDVYAFHSDGSLVLGFPIQGNGRVDGTPILKDIDSDGNNDLVLATRDAEIKVWNLLGSGTEWGELAHDRWHTGLYGFVPPDTFISYIPNELTLSFSIFRLASISPNPFTKKTIISFQLPSTKNHQRATLSIYDLAGRLIRQFNNLTNKDSPVVWNAENSPSCAYFVRLEFGDSIDTKKVILVK